MLLPIAQNPHDRIVLAKPRSAQFGQRLSRFTRLFGRQSTSLQTFQRRVKSLPASETRPFNGRHQQRPFIAKARGSFDNRIRHTMRVGLADDFCRILRQCLGWVLQLLHAADHLPRRCRRALECRPSSRCRRRACGPSGWLKDAAERNIQRIRGVERLSQLWRPKARINRILPQPLRKRIEALLKLLNIRVAPERFNNLLVLIELVGITAHHSQRHFIATANHALCHGIAQGVADVLWVLPHRLKHLTIAWANALKCLGADDAITRQRTLDSRRTIIRLIQCGRGRFDRAHNTTPLKRFTKLTDWPCALRKSLHKLVKPLTARALLREVLCRTRKVNVLTHGVNGGSRFGIRHGDSRTPLSHNSPEQRTANGTSSRSF